MYSYFGTNHPYYGLTAYRNNKTLEKHQSLFPLEGRGKGFLGCDKYDDGNCLCHALEWSCFHCDGCRYENRTTDKYPKAEYIPDLIELVEGIWISALPGP